MAKNPLKNLVQGAFILTLAAFIAKVLSAVYRVPLQNFVGDEGFYVYQQVYPFYGLAMTLALTGLPQFISKYVAEQHDPNEQTTVFAQLQTFICWLALALWALVWFGSSLIAYLMGDLALEPVIQVASYTFLLIPPLTLYRGYLQGQFILVPTAVSQVVEQFLRVGVILWAALQFRYVGGWSIYQVSQVAMWGSFVGGVAAIGLLARAHHRAGFRAFGWTWRALSSWPKKTIRRRFLIEGGLVSLYSGYLILFQLLDSFLLVNFLEKSGLTATQARVEKGVFDRGQPLVQLGLVVALALSTSFLPMLTKYLRENQPHAFLFSTKLYLRLTTALGLAASVGLALVMPYMNYALFKDQAGNTVLSVFVFAVALMAVIQGYQSVAQSQNRLKASIRAALIGLIMKGLLMPGLVYILGTLGASLATVVALATTLFLLVKQEQASINHFWRERAFGWRLSAALGVMILSLLLFNFSVARIFGELQQRETALFLALLGVAVGLFSFMGTLLKFQVFTIREWLVLPFGKKILQGTRRKNEIR